jgi:DNA-binding transcriptional LysR family regulator
MDLTQLRSFVTVARLGHLTRAAEAVHLSQPAISGQIKALERDFGVALFERTPSGMVLTPAGKRLLPHAESVIGGVQHLREAALELSAQLTGRLRLGTVLDPAFLRVGELIAAAYERHPAVELDLHQVVSNEALEQVRSGELDASFYFGALPADLAGIELRTIDYRIVVPAALAAAHPGADWAHLATHPWIVTPERSSHRQLVLQLFAEQGGDLARTVEADNESVITNLVESGVGVGLIRDEIAQQSVRARRAVIWPGASMRTRLWLVHAKDRSADPLLGAVLEVVEEIWRPVAVVRDADTVAG